VPKKPERPLLSAGADARLTLIPAPLARGNSSPWIPLAPLAKIIMIPFLLWETCSPADHGTGCFFLFFEKRSKQAGL